MGEFLNFLKSVVENDVSDIFIISGLKLSVKIHGNIEAASDEIIMPERADQIIREIYSLASRPLTRYLENGDDEFSLSIKGLSRFRVSVYKQRGSTAAIIRVVRFNLPDFKALGIPDEVLSVAEKRRGLVLVTGPAGSGKSTTLAYITDTINKKRNSHIITIEDPIEFLHQNKLSAVSQREIGTDTESYLTALRACLRQAPDVILLGEMRDLDTIRAAMTAAETGHLVISTLHTLGAVNTIDRIIDVFPPNQQQQVRVQLSMVLQTVISQQLIPTEGGNLASAFEIMHLNSAIRNLIRESKVHQIDSVIQSSASEGMVSMDSSIFELYKNKQINAETAMRFAHNPEQLARKLATVS